MKYKNKPSLILINKARNFMIQKNLILYKNQILITFSGGQDSSCLIILMLQFTNQFGLYLGLIYCNHLWHLNNLYRVSHLLKINFFINKPFFFIVASKKIFTEKKARIWRYSTMDRIAKFYNYQVILTGHTLTDQSETLLLNLFRSPSQEAVTSLLMNQFIINKSIKKVFPLKQELNSKPEKYFNDLYFLSKKKKDSVNTTFIRFK